MPLLPLGICVLIVTLHVPIILAQLERPSERDTVHTIWLNGPTHSGKLGGNWPSFVDNPDFSLGPGTCATTNEKYTGYNTNGGYCQPASSNDLNEEAHLLVASGRVAIVLDPQQDSTSSFNFVPKLGAVPSSLSFSSSTTREIAASLDQARLDATVSIACGDDAPQDLRLGSIEKFADVGLVRQGQAMTHVTVTDLKWMNSTTNEAFTWGFGDLWKPFTNGVPPNFVRSSSACKQESSGRIRCPLVITNEITDGESAGRLRLTGALTGDSSRCTFEVSKIEHWAWKGANLYFFAADGVKLATVNQCLPAGSTISATYYDEPPTVPTFWLELSVWGDSIALELFWDQPLPTNCSAGEIGFSLYQGSPLKLVAEANNTDFSSSTTRGSATLFLTPSSNNEEILVQEQQDNAFNNDLIVSSSTAGSTIVSRSTTRDIVVEVPKNTPKCGYNTQCANVVIPNLNLTLTNNNILSQTVRLSISRNFVWRTSDFDGQQSQPSAEITGLSAFFLDTTSLQPLGLSSQISKNWHSNDEFWGEYEGTWWTTNTLFRIPPSSTVTLTMAMAYEKYGDIPAFSHAQLSIVGYSHQWLWEEAALGSGGENICFDPLGGHTRAAVTDIRPKLFDGDWKENVGGADFLIYFDQAGAFQYKKELDPQLLSNGPCLSNATYSSISSDGAIASEVQVSGGRTDDLVRVFFHVKHTVLEATTFSRLAFFQFGSETYNYNSNFGSLIFGSGQNSEKTVLKNCTGGSSKATDQLYEASPGQGLFREHIPGSGPWWVGTGPNENIKTYNSTDRNCDDNNCHMVVGDRGMVVRTFQARFDGQDYSSPSFSTLCDKVEIGPPVNVNSLQAGDYVDMRIELIILPRAGKEFNAALLNSPNSESLKYLNTTTTLSWERVREQATHDISVEPMNADVAQAAPSVVESHYPIRVCNPTGVANTRFKVNGRALGLVPVVICGLATPTLDIGHGLWARPEGTTSFVLLKDTTTYRQANLVRETDTYELVFNVQLGPENYTDLAFGTNPDLEVSMRPSQFPSQSQLPSDFPSQSPSRSQLPSQFPSEFPSQSQLPSQFPSQSPSQSQLPSQFPSEVPSQSQLPSEFPSEFPSLSQLPSQFPSQSPSQLQLPSHFPSEFPSTSLSLEPSVSMNPSRTLSVVPSKIPSVEPSVSPNPPESPSPHPSTSYNPSVMPSDIASKEPSVYVEPSSVPSGNPSSQPRSDSLAPSSEPTANPSPSAYSTKGPTNNPTNAPQPTNAPTNQPNNNPTNAPINTPQPTNAPTNQPTNTPTKAPTPQPTTPPTNAPNPPTPDTDTPTPGPTNSNGPTTVTESDVLADIRSVVDDIEDIIKGILSPEEDSEAIMALENATDALDEASDAFNNKNMIKALNLVQDAVIVLRDIGGDSDLNDGITDLIGDLVENMIPLVREFVCPLESSRRNRYLRKEHKPKSDKKKNDAKRKESKSKKRSNSNEKKSKSGKTDPNPSCSAAILQLLAEATDHQMKMEYELLLEQCIAATELFLSMQ